MNVADVRIGMMVRMTDEGKAFYLENLHGEVRDHFIRLGPQWEGRVVSIRQASANDPMMDGEYSGQFYVTTNYDEGGVWVKFIEPVKDYLNVLVDRLERDLHESEEKYYYPYNSDMR